MWICCALDLMFGLGFGLTSSSSSVASFAKMLNNYCTLGSCHCCSYLYEWRLFPAPALFTETWTGLLCGSHSAYCFHAHVSKYSTCAVYCTVHFVFTLLMVLNARWRASEWTVCMPYEWMNECLLVCSMVTGCPQWAPASCSHASCSAHMAFRFRLLYCSRLVAPNWTELNWTPTGIA